MPTKAHGQARFVATGKTSEFAGYRLAYVEDLEDADSELAEAERVLPNLRQGQQAAARELKPAGHTTQPPPRITEAGLIKELEARGIGRPSTYAAIIETIVRREYVFKRATALVPTFTAFAVVDLLASYLGWLVDYQFTAKMEDDLDEISNGKQKRLDYLKHFFLGSDGQGGTPGLRDRVSGIEGDIDPRKICSIPLGTNEAGELVEVRVGRYGPFLSCGDKRAPVPDETAPDEMTLARGIDLLVKGGDGPKVLGTDPATNLPVFVKVGRFGPYFQLGEAMEAGKKKGDKPKMASLLAGMTPETVTLDEALATLALPRTVGVATTPAAADGTPGTAEPVLAANGRFGPYLKWGKETRSIPAGHTPLTVDLALAMELFAQPKTGRGGRGKPSQQKARRELGESPVTKQVVKLLDGRYGPYVTDGTTNASLNKDENPDELTLPRALDLLAARAARGPAKKKPARRSKKATTS
jgi:DNA topoisomerase-1